MTDNGEVVHDWALAGRAVALKMEADVQEDLRSGRLVRLLQPFECDESKLYVTYAKQDPTKTVDAGGAGNGYVAVFDTNGNLLKHLISNGQLNSHSSPTARLG